MSYYRFTNSTTLGGKYAANWGQGYSVQKGRWKRWSNSTGYDMFVPENSSSERLSVNDYLQNVSGITRTVGWFGSADGRNIVTSVAIPANNSYCHSQVPGFTGSNYPSLYGYDTAPACPGGTVDRFGSLYGDYNEYNNIGESQDNPYYTQGLSSNSQPNFYLASRYTKSYKLSAPADSVWDYYINLCYNPTFPYRIYQIRQCYIEAQRGRCWDQCGNSVPAVLETLVVGGGGSGAGSYRDYFAGGDVPVFDDEGNFLGTIYVEPYEYIRLGGGGGAGGFRSSNVTIEVDSTYSISVGAGGSGSGGSGVNGSSSSFTGTSFYNSGNSVSIVAQGGGGGGHSGGGAPGGSGGGGASYYNNGTWTFYAGGAGNTSPQMGSNGSSGGTTTGGGGGGASEAGGTDGSGHGGDGLSSSISGTGTNYAGGGAGANAGNNGGIGGGGHSVSGTNGTSGTANTGGGGGAGGGVTSTGTNTSGQGGSGYVIIRYPDFLANASTVTGSPTFTLTGGYRIYTFTGSGSLKWTS